MSVSLAIIQPQVSIVIDGEDPQVLTAIDADTLNGVTAGATGLLLLATATAGAARTVLGVDSDDAVTFGALTAPSLRASTSGGLLLLSSNGTTVATIGAGPGTGVTFAGGVNMQALGCTTAVIGTDPVGSELLRFTGSQRITGNIVCAGGDGTGLQFSDGGGTYRTRYSGDPDYTKVASPDGIYRIYFANAATYHDSALHQLRGYAGGSTATVIGNTDPGGSELLRVGGAVTAAGAFRSTAANLVSAPNQAILDFLLGARVQSFGADASTYGTISFIQRSSDASLARTQGKLNADGSWVLGTDPGGSELLRVGGTARFGGKITTVSAVPGSFADLAAVQTWLAAQFT
jgi:hypothetical protein